jgi:hypothetical protein
MSDNRTFVSYSRADSEFALKLASDLRANGASIWLDQLDIAPGARWDSAIEDALRGAARVIVVLSPKAVASQNVLDEVSFALDEGKAIVPVLVETCAVPMRLRRLQHVDFTPGYEAALGRLLVTLGVARTSVSRTATPPPEPEPKPEPPRQPQEALRDFATLAPSPANGQRTMLFAGVAAAIVVFVGVAIWMSSRPDGAPNAPADAAVDTSASTPPGETPAPNDATAAPPAAADGAASKAVRMAESGTSVEALSKVLGPGVLDSGLESLQRLTRELSTRDTLTTADLERVADAQLKSCAGEAPSSPCNQSAQSAVSSLLSTVCTRSVGPKPASQAAALLHETKMVGCEQNYSTTLLNRFDEATKAAIRHIKPG